MTDYSHWIGGTREIFGGADTTCRSEFSSNPTPSDYLVIPGYGVVNARIGFRPSNRWSVSIWARNLLDKDYYEMLTGVGGNTGIFVGFLGDPRTYGVTLRTSLGGN